MTAALAAAALVVSACSDSSPSGSSGGGVGQVDRVVMIGDSITVGSRSALQDEFESLGFGDIVIESQSSKRTASGSSSNPSGVAIARSLVESFAADGVATAGQVWVVALGTNDINQYSDVDRLTGVIDEMLSVVPVDVALIWVDTYGRDLTDGAALVNEVITERVGLRDDAAVARWSEVAADEGNLRIDGLHPGDQGALVFASTVGDAIRELLDLPQLSQRD